MRTRTTLVVAAAVLVGVAWGSARTQPASGPEYTKSFRLQDATLLPIGANPYFSLQPGRFWRYEGVENGDSVRLEVRNLPQTKWITFSNLGQPLSVLTRVVEERLWVEDALVEVSRHFYARDLNSRNVYYLGEEVDIYDNGQIVSHEGAWRAGVNNAKPGLIMPGVFLLGSRYVQSIAPGVALDLADHEEMGVIESTPAGHFINCVVVRETTPLDPSDLTFKTYAPGVGMVKDGALELVEFQ